MEMSAFAYLVGAALCDDYVNRLVKRISINFVNKLAVVGNTYFYSFAVGQQAVVIPLPRPTRLP